MRCAVKKVPAQIEMMYDKNGVIVVILKSLFLPKKQDRRILRGYCRYDRPSSMYLYICWVGGPIQGHLVVRGRVKAVMEVHISE